MSIDAIVAAGSAVAPFYQPGVERANPVTQPDFAQWLAKEVNDVNAQIQTAEQSIAKLAVGEGNLHQVMLELEKARTTFQLTLQVRNKLLEGYQELMRMQI